MPLLDLQGLRQENWIQITQVPPLRLRDILRAVYYVRLAQITSKLWLIDVISPIPRVLQTTRGFYVSDFQSKVTTFYPRACHDAHIVWAAADDHKMQHVWGVTEDEYYPKTAAP